MASTQKVYFREEETSGNGNDKDGFFSYFKKDKRQRFGSEEEMDRNSVIQKLNKIESHLSELKGLKRDMEEEKITDTPLEVSGIRTDFQKMFEFMEGVRSSLIEMVERLLQQEKNMNI